MTAVKTDRSLLGFFSGFDAQPGREDKLRYLAQWARDLDGVSGFRFLDSQDIPPGNSFQGGPRLSQPLVLTASSRELTLLQLGEEWEHGALFFPLPMENDFHSGAFLFQTHSPLELLSQKGQDIGLVAHKVGDWLKLNRNRSTPAAPPVSNRPSGLELMETIGLPAYAAKITGEIHHVNPAFLQAFGFSTREEFDLQAHGFFHPQERSEQIRLLARKGRCEGYQLTVHHSSSRKKILRDWAVLSEGIIFGVLVDVSDFIHLNREMKEALEVQEALNDQILSSAMVLHRTQTTSIRALARLAEYRDNETGSHLTRICEYTGILGRELLSRNIEGYTINDQFLEDLVLSSMLHDVGKVAVPDSILRKNMILNDQEWEIMRSHTLWGWQILSQADKELGQESFLTLASQIALHHHEKWDGTGYPHGLAGDEIPLAARLEALADVYDALSSSRPYKPAWTHEETLAEIKSLRGTHFDPVLVDIFLELEDKFREVKEKFARETV